MSRTVASLSVLLALSTLPGLALSACKDDGNDAPVPTPTADAGSDAGLQLTFSEPPIPDLPQGVRFASAVPYGSDPMQVVDILLPASTAPTGAILYFHGGGFMVGSRTDAYTYNADQVRKSLAAGIAWISVEYRLLQAPGEEKEGVIKSLRDCQRALQFVRYFSSTLNVDPKRVGANGNSAGAGASLWLAFHDDMAKADSADPIERESTRPLAVSVDQPQATYDVLRWAPDVMQGEYPYITNDSLIQQPELRTVLVQFYGLDATLADDGAALLTALNGPSVAAYRANVDLLALVSSDDTPAFLLSSFDAIGPIEPGFDLLHHPLHGKTLYTFAKQAGAPVEASVPAYAISSASTPTDFLIQKLAL